VTRLAEQAAAIAERAPDVVALQEVTARSAPLWREALAGYEVTASLDSADPAREPAGPRRAGVLLATREPHAQLPERLPVPWPESALSVRLGDVEVHCVHVPNAANGIIKPQTLAAVRLGLEQRGAAQILCGDLNTPRRETRDGEVITFGQDSRGRLRPERGEAWDMAERAVVPGLSDIGFRDAFRAVNGYGVREISWAWQRFGGGYRIDHVFCSARLQPVAARYHHAWREDGLSDHSALEADLLLG
jgi:exonuclease III